MQKPNKKKIVEFYDQENFVVIIEKTVEGKDAPEKTVIKKEDRIDNIYCFIYRVRNKNSFKVGNSFKMNLPTKDVSVKIAKKRKIKAAGKRYWAYYLHTVPAQYRLWFTESDGEIPIRIDKPAAFGGTSMLMTEYKK